MSNIFTEFEKNYEVRRDKFKIKKIGVKCECNVVLIKSSLFSLSHEQILCGSSDYPVVLLYIHIDYKDT